MKTSSSRRKSARRNAARKAKLKKATDRMARKLKKKANGHLGRS